MSRAELYAWAHDPRRAADDEFAAAVREFFRDFAALCDLDGVCGYETVKADNAILRSHADQLLAENARLRRAAAATTKG